MSAKLNDSNMFHLISCGGTSQDLPQMSQPAKLNTNQACTSTSIQGTSRQHWRLNTRTCGNIRDSLETVAIAAAMLAVISSCKW